MRRDRSGSSPPQSSEGPNEVNRNLCAGGGSRLQFVKNALSVKSDKQSAMRRGTPVLRNDCKQVFQANIKIIFIIFIQKPAFSHLCWIWSSKCEHTQFVTVGLSDLL